MLFKKIEMIKRKIIIVDDQASYRNSLKNILGIIGNVQIIGEASNGKDYLKLLDKERPDVTFMDIEMPGMDGIEATKKAIEKDKTLVIIGLSLYANEDYIKQLVEAGARGYLLKLSNNYSLFKSILNYPEADVFFSEKVKGIMSKSSSRKKTILIVDDFETNTIVVASALRTAGYNVLKAVSAREAIRYIIDEEPIDLVVADFNMPHKNGAQLIAEIKKYKAYQKIPALILSSDNDPRKKQEAKKAGAFGWMRKPFQLAKFINVVNNVMNK